MSERVPHPATPAGTTWVDVGVLVVGCLVLGFGFEFSYAWWVPLAAVATWIPAVWFLEAPRVLVGDRPSKARLVGLRILGFGTVLASINLVLAAVL